MQYMVNDYNKNQNQIRLEGMLDKQSSGSTLNTLVLTESILKVIVELFLSEYHIVSYIREHISLLFVVSNF